MPDLAPGDAADDRPIIALLVDFAHALRQAGIAVGPGDVVTFCSAMAPLDPTDLLDLYWAGQATLVTRHEQLPVYEAVFREFFLGETLARSAPAQLHPRASAPSESVLQVPETEPGKQRDEQILLGLMASDAETLRNKSFTACSPDELAVLRRIMRRIRLSPPKRRTRRTVAASAGRSPDPRRTLRETMRLHGEPARLYWRRRRLRLRPLIFILDISGSMADYSRSLLQFAYSAHRAASRVEVFCFGTRLTRITGELERRNPDDALARAARAVVDWEGGTRIGESLDTFVRNWGRRGLCRGGIVVICSDGLDRGDPATLAAAMERLKRQSHSIVWMNPHKGNDVNFRPSTVGMMVSAPHVDHILSGHDLRSLEDLATLLPRLR